MKRLLYSYSAFRLFQRCPLAYKLKYEYGHPEAANEYGNIGKAVHQIMADMAIGAATADQIEDETIRENVKFRYPAGVCPSDSMPYVETKIEADRITGVIDLYFKAGDTLVIRDYKTGAVPERDKLSENLQFRIYAWMLNNFLGLRFSKVRLERDWLRHEFGFQWEIVDDPSIFNSVPDEIDALIKEIEDSDYRPNIGPHCASCGLRGSCPTFSQALVLPGTAEITAQNAGEYAATVWQIAAVVEEAKAAVRAWVAENGPIEYEGKTLSLQSRTKTTIDKTAAIGALKAHGRQSDAIFQAMNLGSGALKDLCKGRDDQSKKLRETIKELELKSPDEPALKWADKK